MRILVVCMGNICRSPMAEIVLKDKVHKYKKEWLIESAGTIGFHEGENADERAIKTCYKHGLDLSRHRARQFKVSDFENYDHILVMDRTNLRDVNSKARTEYDRNKVRFFTHLSKTSPNSEVPDPYYEGNSGFDLVFNQLDEAAECLIKLL